MFTTSKSNKSSPNSSHKIPGPAIDNSFEVAPEPPSQVWAVGLEDSAIVWFDLSGALKFEVSQWEICRYRFQNGKWTWKGSSTSSGVLLSRHTISNLQTNSRYRFTVIGVNGTGKGLESKMSSEILVEPRLPNGWFRLKDPVSGKYFYMCPGDGKSSWSRPDDNPFFVDYSISMNFTDNEMKSLVDIYLYEIRNFERISKERLIDVMEEIGRSCPDIRFLERLFKEVLSCCPEEQLAVADKKPPTEQVESLRTFKGFMLTMQFLKIRALKLKNNASYLLSEMALMRMGRDRSGDEVNPVRIGNWVKSDATILKRSKYRGILTKEKTWFTPVESRLFLSEDEYHYLSVIFTAEEIEMLETIYLYLDVNMLGSVHAQDFFRFLNIISSLLSQRGNGGDALLGSNNTQDPILLEQCYTSLFHRLDQGGKKSLSYRDFVCFFVNLPLRAAQVHLTQPCGDEPQISSADKKNLTADVITPTKKNDNNNNNNDNDDAVQEFDNDFEIIKSNSRKQAASEQLKQQEILMEASAVTGNEFRIVQLVDIWPVVARFESVKSDLNFIMENLFSTNVIKTVWDVNKLAASDLLTAIKVFKIPLWVQKLVRNVKTRIHSIVHASKKLFKRKKIHALSYSVSDHQEDGANEMTDDDRHNNNNEDGNEIMDVHDDEDVQEKSNQNKNDRDHSDNDEENDGSGIFSYSLFHTNTKDTTATHGPCCFCGCGNEFWTEEFDEEEDPDAVQQIDHDD